ncbi:hypothetical protein [Saccharothrix australiensis]|uniref:DUF5709 domain-containing protein n=1 Tax=Saccharothrix australiensis TaxID=2072 RepID=A0A495VYQ3_9PSEU|nr:hypothetical protein [Saccharothrix australiensis]RKT54379.1 hypothetical protein C8E97_2999 [Saccharothrix australiensis]
MANGEPRSEQQEGLEGVAWADERVDEPGTGGTRGPQFTRPDDVGSSADVEATEIAEEAGSDYTAGPEQRAMHVEEGDEGGGRVGR